MRASLRTGTLVVTIALIAGMVGLIALDRRSRREGDMPRIGRARPADIPPTIASAIARNVGAAMAGRRDEVLVAMQDVINAAVATINNNPNPTSWFKAKADLKYLCDSWDAL